MTQGISRRDVIAGVGAAATIVAPAPAGAHIPDLGKRMTVSGTVAWCHKTRGLLMFDTEPRGRDGTLIRLTPAAVTDPNLRPLRAGSAVSVTFAWRPDLDVVSPWVPVEVIAPNGNQFAVVAPEEVLARARSSA